MKLLSAKGGSFFMLGLCQRHAVLSVEFAAIQALIGKLYCSGNRHIFLMGRNTRSHGDKNMMLVVDKVIIADSVMNLFDGVYARNETLFLFAFVFLNNKEFFSAPSAH